MAAALAVVALGTAWRWFATGLSVAERRLVGTWRNEPGAGGGLCVWRFDPDRRCRGHLHFPAGRDEATTVEFSGAWSACGGSLIIDGEPSAVRRAVRPLLELLAVPVGGTIPLTVESAGDDETVIRTVSGSREVWTRVRDD